METAHMEIFDHSDNSHIQNSFSLRILHIHRPDRRFVDYQGFILIGFELFGVEAALCHFQIKKRKKILIHMNKT